MIDNPYNRRRDYTAGRAGAARDGSAMTNAGPVAKLEREDLDAIAERAYWRGWRERDGQANEAVASTAARVWDEGHEAGVQDGRAAMHDEIMPVVDRFTQGWLDGVRKWIRPGKMPGERDALTESPHPKAARTPLWKIITGTHAAVDGMRREINNMAPPEDLPF